MDGGLVITPWHPVRLHSKWIFPCEVSGARVINERPCTAYYSFVLDCNHSVFINDVECVTLGHGFSDEVVRHAYFGTSAVLVDLAAMDGWAVGLIHLREGCCLRDPQTGLICKLVQHGDDSATASQACEFQAHTCWNTAAILSKTNVLIT
jgi:hypothetical protein